MTAENLKELAALRRQLASDPKTAEAMTGLVRQYEAEIAEIQRSELKSYRARQRPGGGAVRTCQLGAVVSCCWWRWTNKRVATVRARSAALSRQSSEPNTRASLPRLLTPAFQFCQRISRGWVKIGVRRVVIH